MTGHGFSAVALAALAAGSAWTQNLGKETQGFGVSPVSLSLQGRPGQRIQGTFTVAVQNTKGPTRFAVKIADLGQVGAAGVGPVALGIGARSCAGWIAVADRLELAPKASRQVPFTLTVPAGAAGAYYAIVSVELVVEGKRSPMAAVVTPSVAVQIEALVPGQAPFHVDVTSLSVVPGKAGSAAAVVLRAANTGVWKATVEGDVLVYGASGFPIRAPIPYPATGQPTIIYPGLTVDLRCPLSGFPGPGRYRALARLLLVGKYQVRSWFDIEVPASGAKAIAAKPKEKSELDVALQVTPDVVDVTMAPGARHGVPIKVQNQGDHPVRVEVEPATMRMEPNGMLTYPEGTGDTAQEWISVSPTALTLAPQQTGVVRATVVVPTEGAAPSSTVRVVRFRVVPSAVADSSGWTSSGDFAVMVLVHDPKAPPANLQTEGLDLVRASPKHNPSAAVLRARNTGGRLARVFGRIVLERTSGDEISHMDIGAQSPELFMPGDGREFRMPLPPLDAGDFRVRAELKLQDKDKGASDLGVAQTFTISTPTPAGLSKPIPKKSPATTPAKRKPGTKKGGSVG